MVVFILYILCAVLWTAAAIKMPYKETKKAYFFCAFLWWACVAISIIEFAIA